MQDKDSTPDPIALPPLCRAAMSAFALWEASRREDTKWSRTIAALRGGTLPTGLEAAPLPVEPWGPGLYRPAFPDATDAAAADPSSPFGLYRFALQSSVYEQAAREWAPFLPRFGLTLSPTEPAPAFAVSLLAFLAVFDVGPSTVVAAVAGALAQYLNPIYRPEQLPAELLLRRLHFELTQYAQTAADREGLQRLVDRALEPAMQYLAQAAAAPQEGVFVRIEPWMASDDVERLLATAMAARPGGRPPWWQSPRLVLSRMDTFARHDHLRASWKTIAARLDTSAEGPSNVGRILQHGNRQFKAVLERFRKELGT